MWRQRPSLGPTWRQRRSPWRSPPSRQSRRLTAQTRWQMRRWTPERCWKRQPPLSLPVETPLPTPMTRQWRRRRRHRRQATQERRRSPLCSRAGARSAVSSMGSFNRPLLDLSQPLVIEHRHTRPALQRTTMKDAASILNRWRRAVKPSSKHGCAMPAGRLPLRAPQRRAYQSRQLASPRGRWPARGCRPQR